MIDDNVLTVAEADAFHRYIVAAGELLIWTVYAYPTDYPDRYVARPYGAVVGHPLKVVLVADALDDLRGMIPRGLVALTRNTKDDPCIVESWL